MQSQTTNRAIFIFASLIPLPLLMAAATSGGVFTLLAMVYMTLAVIVFGELSDTWRAQAEQTAGELVRDFFPLLLGIAHFAVLGTAVHTLGAASTSFLEWIVHLYVFSLFFGMISFANAKHLVHRKSHPHRKLGDWIYASLLFGHHSSVQLLVAKDRATNGADLLIPRKGETVYRFAWRAALGTFRQALAAEADLQRQRPKQRLHPFVTRGGISALFLILTGYLAGAKAVLGILCLALIAQFLTYLVIYVRTYGLSQVAHSANLPSDALQWNAQTLLSHKETSRDTPTSLHHFKQQRAGTDIPVPQLPYGLLAMSMLALIPSKWRRMMNPRVAVWRDTAHYLN